MSLTQHIDSPALVEEKSRGSQIDSIVMGIFSELDRAGIQYVLLRGNDEWLAAGKNLELDLLIKPEQRSPFAEVLTQKGFMELPSWGHAPHYFFVTYLPGEGIWLKLDVVTALCYGRPVRKLNIGFAEQCLASIRKEGVHVPDYDAEFLTLFLHCLLDKNEFRPEHGQRLSFLFNVIEQDDKIGEKTSQHIRQYLAPALEWNTLARAAKDENWQSLLKRRAAVARKLFWRNPTGAVWRSVRAKVGLWLRPFLFALRRRGLAVALLAPDGAGKSTLALKLQQDQYIRARLIYMGTNVEAQTVGLPSSKWLAMRAKSIKKSESSHGIYGILIRALNFVNKLTEQWYRSAVAWYHLIRGRVVIFDRYIYDSWLQKRKKTPWKRLRKFIFEAACPTPGLVVLLDAPGVLLFKRKGEHSPEWLEKQRLAYLDLAEELPGVEIVDGRQSAEPVKREVTQLIFQKLWSQARETRR